MTREQIDSIVGLELDDGYRIDRHVESGAVGSVFHAIRDDAVHDERAIKFVPASDVRPTWNLEINKVTGIAVVPSIVPYLGYGDVTVSGVEYRWIAWKFIHGQSVRSLIASGSMTMPIPGRRPA